MKDEIEKNRTGPASKSRLPGWKLALLLAGVFFLALGVRVVYLDQIGAGSGGASAGNVFYDSPKLDSANYHETALRILAGEETAEGVLTYNPLYPVILSLLYRFMDAPDFHVVRLIQCVLGSLMCLLLVFLGRRFFVLRTGLIAALAAALYGPFLFFDGELIQSTWVLFCLTLSFLVLPLAPARKGAAGIALCLLAGLLFGVGLLGRPNLLLFLLFF